MARASKFTDGQKLEIALDLLSGKMSQAHVCRKWDIRELIYYSLQALAIVLVISRFKTKA
jgi:transposase-like protein